MGKGISFALLAGLLGFASAQGLDVGSRDAILKSASVVAEDLMAIYEDGKESPGIFANSTYAYWEGGVMMSALIDYWHLTNDSKYNDIVKEAMLYQYSNDTFTPETVQIVGNDDQCFWALAAMQAAEDELPEPSTDQKWISMAEAVFDQQMDRLSYEGDVCGGGLRWGMETPEWDWSWKISRTNGCLFNLAARLARYTGNSTYSDTAIEFWDWMSKVKLITADGWRVLQGADIKDNCTTIEESYFSAEGAIVTQGAAFMFNNTNGSDEWRTRVEKLTASLLKDFFPNNIAFEPDCEVQELCNAQKLAYKGVSVRAMAVATQLAPFISSTVLTALQDTAKAMALGCKNGDMKRKCQFYWLDLDPKLIMPEENPKTSGVGEQMNALGAISNLLLAEADPPAVAPPQPGRSGSGENKKGAGNKIFGAPSFVLIVLAFVVSTCL